MESDDDDSYVQEGTSQQVFYPNKDDGPTKARPQGLNQTPVGESTGKKGPSKKKTATTPKQNGEKRQTAQAPPAIASPSVSISNNDAGIMINKDVGNIINSNFSNMGNNNSRNYYGKRGFAEGY